jgi:hypothetical protein
MLKPCKFVNVVSYRQPHDDDDDDGHDDDGNLSANVAKYMSCTVSWPASGR